jgi:hypothetical protein
MKSSSTKTFWRIRKLQVILLVRKTHFFHPAKISNKWLAGFMNYGAAK